VESVLQQTNGNYELILVDDGATDASGQMCDQFAELYKQIKVVHKENGGLSDARNAGVDIADGDYLLFLDGDDYLKENALENIACTIERTKYPDLIYSNGNYEFGENKELFLCNEIVNMPAELPEVITGTAFLKYLLKHGIAGWSAWGKVWKREFWNENHFLYRKRFMEDIDVAYKFFEKAERVTYTAPYYCYFRGRDGSLLTNFKAENLKIYIEILKEWQQYLMEDEIADQELKQLIYNRFAKEYCEAILGKIYFAGESDKTELLEKAEKLSGYLKASNSRQSKTVRICLKIMGFKNTCFWLNQWKRMKNGTK
jgi:glycosyltransferase involved in cell wall biosynthesis